MFLCNLRDSDKSDSVFPRRSFLLLQPLSSSVLLPASNNQPPRNSIYSRNKITVKLPPNTDSARTDSIRTSDSTSLFLFFFIFLFWTCQNPTTPPSFTVPELLDSRRDNESLKFIPPKWNFCTKTFLTFPTTNYYYHSLDIECVAIYVLPLPP